MTTGLSCEESDAHAIVDAAIDDVFDVKRDRLTMRLFDFVEKGRRPVRESDNGAGVSMTPRTHEIAVALNSQGTALSTWSCSWM